MAKIGRPLLMTPEKVAKLEEYFSHGCTDREACILAGVSKDTLYAYQRANPDFINRKETLKELIILSARETINKSIKTDPKMAIDFMKRKKRKEFGDKQEIDHNITGEVKLTDLFSGSDTQEKD